MNVVLSMILGGCTEDKAMDSASDVDVEQYGPTAYNPDVNQDGMLSILILGSSQSIGGEESFSTTLVAQEVRSIFTADSLIDLDTTYELFFDYHSSAEASYSFPIAHFISSMWLHHTFFKK